MTEAISAPKASMRKTSLLLATIGFLCLIFSDIAVIGISPWRELQRIGAGLLQPKVMEWSEFFNAALQTLAFALEGIFLAGSAGFLLALGYQKRWIRWLCAFLRSIHELFWALIFLQLFGLSPLTGVLAIAIPYAGTLAKIYGELLEEVDARPRLSLRQPNRLSAFFYTSLPLAWHNMKSYTSYRMECALRSSIVLGFIGLPTLGFYLESALREGRYHEGAAYLYGLIGLVVALKWLLHPRLLTILIAAAFLYLPPLATIHADNIVRFFSQDIVPAPLRMGWQDGSTLALWSWLVDLFKDQLLPGITNTLLLSQSALVLTGLLALLWFPLNSSHWLNGVSKVGGDSFLILLRSLPEYLLAFIGLLILGPSMLPAILALCLHNGAILAHLLGRFSEDVRLRQDACRGANRYAYELLPRLYRRFLALLLYRWEVILRESAILGMLGIATLGFYIDSAFEELRFDRAALLILCTALLNICVDSFARWLRHRLHLATTVESR